MQDKGQSDEELSWFLTESKKHSEEHEKLIWIHYETRYSKGRIVINPSNLRQLGKARVKKLYKMLQTIGQIVEHGNIEINNEFLTKLVNLVNTKGRL